MKTILITGIGGDIAQGIATIIRESYPNIKLLGSDINSKHAGTLFVDEVFQVVGASSKTYTEQIELLIKTHIIDVVIPTSEQELEVLAPISKELQADCITVGADIVTIGVDKLKTIKCIESFGLPAPWTFLAKDAKPNELPCIFKSQKGSGSKNIFVVKSELEAAFLANKFPDSIFQELLEPADREVTCAVYRTKDGRTAVLQLLRKLTGGLTGWAEVIKNAAVDNMCQQIANDMNLYGSFNIQLRITNAGPRVFEINPRFSSTVLMRHRLGFSDVLWSLDEIMGKIVKFPKVDAGQKMVRIQDVRQLSN